MNRILHTMLRVSDIERSIRFYTKILGMGVLRTVERPDQGFFLTFLDTVNLCQRQSKSNER